MFINFDVKYSRTLLRPALLFIITLSHSKMPLCMWHYFGCLWENLEWLGKASNWSKFTATAALDKGHFEEGINILEPYLPSDNHDNSGSVSGNQFSEGGSLYAIGLINAGCGSGRSVESYLRGRLRVAADEVVQHGAALELGVAVIGGRSSEAYEDLKQTLFTDSVIAGEAAGYRMGLVMLGAVDAQCRRDVNLRARDTTRKNHPRACHWDCSHFLWKTGRSGRDDKFTCEREGLSMIYDQSHRDLY